MKPIPKRQGFEFGFMDGDRFRPIIDVLLNTNLDTLAINEFSVNWRAIGSVDVKVARQFSHLMEDAANFAARLNKQFVGKKASTSENAIIEIRKSEEFL